ncbi:MAG: hypothetical protein J6K29_12000 [Clostridia bacterium]|nr:hypothetical protein [Clostridia bacterium]
MHIYLANHHEALVINDQSDRVTITPATYGILTVGGVSYGITDGGDAPAIYPENAPHTTAVFTASGGIRYTVIAPRVDKGMLTSRPDPYAYILDLRMMVDRLEKELEQTKKELSKHRGKEERRALNSFFKKEA